MVRDWTKIYKRYRGFWIALDEKEKKVVASDKEAKKAFERAQRKGVKLPILFKVPIEVIPYVGGLVKR